MTAENTYSGWSNRATWNVNLWLSNEEGLYRDINRLERRHVGAASDRQPGDNEDFADAVNDFAEAIERFCNDLWEDGKTPDGDLLSDCDFEEVARAWVAG